MLERSMRRTAPGEAVIAAVLHRELTGAEVAGYWAGNWLAARDSSHPNIPAEPPAPDVSPAPDISLWDDAESLVAIARRHAALALAGPPAERESRIAACRTVWIRYAAAFNAGTKTQQRFADELLAVTRALMADQQDSAAAEPARSPPNAAAVITIDELRPILRQIIRSVAPA